MEHSGLRSHLRSAHNSIFQTIFPLPDKKEKGIVAWQQLTLDKIFSNVSTPKNVLARTVFFIDFAFSKRKLCNCKTFQNSNLNVFLSLKGFSIAKRDFEEMNNLYSKVLQDLLWVQLNNIEWILDKKETIKIKLKKFPCKYLIQ